MIKKPAITSVQLMLLPVGSALMFPYTFLPILESPPRNQDVWIAFLLAIVYVMVINFPLLFIINKFRGLNINETLEAIAGKIPGKLVAILFTFFFIFCFTACALVMAMFMNIYILFNTPFWALLLITGVPATYAAYKGAGTLGRLASFLTTFLLLTIAVYFVLGIAKMDLNELKPILSDSSFLDINKGAFFTASRFSEIFIIFVFSFYLRRDISVTKIYFSGLLIFAVSFLLILLPPILVLGVELAKREWNPYYVFTRQVELFGFMERTQAINALAWFPQSILKLGIYNYMASYTLSGVFKTRSHKKFVISLSVIALPLCMLPFFNRSGTVELLRSDKIFPWVLFPLLFVIPAILLIVYLIRRKEVDRVIKEKAGSQVATDDAK